jgi:hypothetical protein
VIFLGYLRLVLALALVTAAGCAAIAVIDSLWPDRGPRPEAGVAGRVVRRWGCAFALGAGLTASWMLLLSAAGIRLSLGSISALGVLPAAVWVLRRRPARSEAGRCAAAAARAPSGAAARCRDLLPRRPVVALLAAAVAVIVLACFIEPVAEVDPTAGWALHAKVFYHERTALPPFLTSGAAGPYVSHWPPVVPLLQTWGHVAMGGYDDRKIKLVFAAAFLALLALVHGTLRERLGSSTALAMVLILATVPALAVPFPAGSVASGYADVPFALFVTAATSSLMAWAGARQTAAIAVAGLAAAFAVWVKVEGLAFAAVSTGCVWLYWAVRWARTRSGGPAQPVLYSALIAFSLVLYALYKGKFNAPVVGEAFDLGRALAPESARAAVKLAGLTCLEALNPVRWGFVWILLAAAVVLRGRHLARPEISMPLLLAAGQVASALAVMAASGLSPEYWAFHTVRRILIHVAPAAVIATGLLAGAQDNGERPAIQASPKTALPGERGRRSEQETL